MDNQTQENLSLNNSTSQQIPIVENPEKAITTKSNSTKIILFSLLGLLVLAGTLISGIYLGKSQNFTTRQPEPKPTLTSQPSPTQIIPTISIVPTLTANTQNLPGITNRAKPELNTSTWQTAKDSQGYQVSYPANWFVSDFKGEISQISNWDPKSIEIPEPLSGNQSKWDINFDLKKFITLEDSLKDAEDSEFNKIEKSTTANGDTVYFTQGTSSFFGDETVRVPFITATVINPNTNNSFTWWGFYSGKDAEAETLKQIVESIKKMN